MDFKTVAGLILLTGLTVGGVTIGLLEYYQYTDKKHTEEYSKKLDSRAEKMAKNNPTYWARKAEEAALDDGYHQVVWNITQAIKLDGLNPKYYITRGIAYLETEQYKKSIKDLNKAMRLDSRSSIPYYLRGIANIQTNNKGQALNDFNSALKRKPYIAQAKSKKEYLIKNRNKAYVNYSKDGKNAYLEFVKMY